MTQKNQSQNNIPSIPPFVFFGGPEISVDFLDTLLIGGLQPSIIITTPDKPSGRKMKLTSPPLKIWADKQNIPVHQPSSLKKFDVSVITGYPLFVVVAYGKIIPQSILDIPEHGSVNLHPSLLPHYRGPSPIISAMLDDEKKTGVSLMLLDALMDHGPIISQQITPIDEWQKNRDTEHFFATTGAELFLRTIPLYLSDKITPTKQDHAQATECRKFEKSDMEIDPTKPRQAYLKYCAFPKPFFFLNNDRIIVTDAEWKNNDFVINTIVPAGKKEMSWIHFKQSRQ